MSAMSGSGIGARSTALIVVLLVGVAGGSFFLGRASVTPDGEEADVRALVTESRETEVPSSGAVERRAFGATDGAATESEDGTSGVGRFSVRIWSGSDLEASQEVTERLRADGWRSVSTEMRRTSAGMTVGLSVGSYDTADAAQTVADSLVDAGYDEARVVVRVLSG